MNIYEKMAAVTEEIGTIAKNLTVSVTKTSSYKAVSERDIIDAVKPLEKKYGIYSYPVDRPLVDSQTLVKENTYNGNTSKSYSMFIRLSTTYRFVNVEDPKDYVETVVYGDGIDSGDKAPGKAMTYADKYALMKAYKISTGDDAEKEDSDPAAPTFQAAAPKGEAPAEVEAPAEKKEPPKMTVVQMVETIKRLYSPEQQATLAKNHAVASVDDITEDELSALMGRLRKAGKI